MNIIVKADLDAAVASMGDQVTSENTAEFKKEAMANAIENLSSRIDKFGLTSPVIRQQGDDRIYIEIPGAAQADAINTLIMGKGILNFRLVDDSATASFKSYYSQHPATTFNAAGELMILLLYQKIVKFLAFIQKMNTVLMNALTGLL